MARYRTLVSIAGTIVAYLALGVVPAYADFVVTPAPDAAYLGSTCKIDLSGIPDFAPVPAVAGCGVVVTFSSMMEKRTAPLGGSWLTWGCPPQTESCTLPVHVLWSMGATSVTMSFSTGQSTYGFEGEPNPLSPFLMTAGYFDSAASHGTISQTVDGCGSPSCVSPPGGAKLFAASTTDLLFTSVTFSSSADWAIGQIRVAAPEASVALLLGTGLLAAFGAARKRFIVA